MNILVIIALAFSAIAFIFCVIITCIAKWNARKIDELLLDYENKEKNSMVDYLLDIIEDFIFSAYVSDETELVIELSDSLTLSHSELVDELSEFLVSKQNLQISVVSINNSPQSIIVDLNHWFS